MGRKQTQKEMDVSKCIQSKQQQEHWEIESSVYQDFCSLDESHDPIDYSNVPPVN